MATGEYTEGNYDELNDEPLDSPIEGVSEGELKNYAGTPVETQEVVQKILEDVILARDRRKAKLEQDWVRYRDIYNCRRTTAYYNGRSKLFLPACRQAVDTLTRIQREALLSDPYLAVETDVPQWEQVGSEFMKQQLERQGKIKQVIPLFLRQLNQIGTSCIKIGFKKEVRVVKYRDRKDRQIKSRRMFTHYGPVYTVVDMRHVGVWPETATDYSDLRIVWHDFQVPSSELRRLAAEGIYSESAVNRAIEHKAQELQADKASESQAQKEMGTDLFIDADLDVTDIWAKFQLPGQEEPQWNLITVSGDVVLRIIENPWWFQLPPYLFGAIFREHDFFYGHGIIETLEMWQYMLNDMANQTMDVGTFTLNPIVAFDPALIDDPDLIQIEPGAKVPDPNVKFERPPAQMSIEGLTMVRFLLNIIQEGSNANALLQGAPREGLGRATGTATGVSQLFAAGNAAVLDQVEDLEAQVFTPLLQCTEIMIHECMDEQMIIRTVGPDGVVLTERVIEPSDLVLSTDIRWVASLRLREKFAKAQQALNFLNIAVRTPTELLRQQGIGLNYKQLFRMVYAGMGLPGVDDVIFDLVQSLPGIPPELETQLIEAGRMVEASPLDTPENHELHLQAHMQYQPPSELARLRMQEHIASHFMALQQQDMQMRAQLQAQTAGGGGMAEGALGLMTGRSSRGPAPEPGLRPQEQPQYETEGATMQGIGSQEGLG